MVYENTADPVWALKALDLYRHRRLQVAAFDTDGVVSAQVWGPCPRCGHDIDVAPTLTTPVPGQGRGWWATLTGQAVSGGDGIPATVEVGCGCGRTHPKAPGTPDGSGTVLGCGQGSGRTAFVSREDCAAAAAAGLPPAVAALLASFGAAIRNGRLDQRSTSVQDVTGRPPRTVAQVLSGAL